VLKPFETGRLAGEAKLTFRGEKEEEEEKKKKKKGEEERKKEKRYDKYSRRNQGVVNRLCVNYLTADERSCCT